MCFRSHIFEGSFIYKIAGFCQRGRRCEVEFIQTGDACPADSLEYDLSFVMQILVRDGIHIPLVHYFLFLNKTQQQIEQHRALRFYRRSAPQ